MIYAVEDGSLSENLAILDRVLPLDRMRMLEVLEGRNTDILILCTDGLTKRQKHLRKKPLSEHHVNRL